MEKIKAWVGRLRGFFDEVGVELRKCSWPTGRELSESTVVVIVSVLLLAFFVFVSDGALVMALRLVIRT